MSESIAGKRGAFGADFYWGVSTAAYQIEGAFASDGKGRSIWDDFVANKKNFKGDISADIGCNHYHLIEEDLDIIASLNLKNYRFSISWSRIFPEGEGSINQKGVDFYNALIDGCLERNITPWITLYHWDLPSALEHKGGWTSREILYWFEDYVTFCIRQFGDRVRHWMVLNEPMVFTGAGYFLGYHAPGKKGISNFLAAMHHATLCQSMGGQIIRSEKENAHIGTTFSCSPIDPIHEKPRHQTIAKRFDALLNRLFLEPALGLGYPIADLPVLKKVEKYIWPNDIEAMPFDFDFIGVQNYTREVVKHNFFIPYIKGKIVDAVDRNVPTTTMGWEVYPESIYRILKKYNAYEGVRSLIVTENGVAYNDVLVNNTVKDEGRIAYLDAYLAQVLKAKKEGIAVDGYFVWALMDNFEWAEGITQRFGLVYTDFETQKRYLKNSALWFKAFLEDD